MKNLFIVIFVIMSTGLFSQVVDTYSPRPLVGLDIGGRPSYNTLTGGIKVGGLGDRFGTYAFYRGSVSNKEVQGVITERTMHAGGLGFIVEPNKQIMFNIGAGWGFVNSTTLVDGFVPIKHLTTTGEWEENLWGHNLILDMGVGFEVFNNTFLTFSYYSGTSSLQMGFITKL